MSFETLPGANFEWRPITRNETPPDVGKASAAALERLFSRGTQPPGARPLWEPISQEQWAEIDELYGFSGL
jgi:hypothetical protein